MTLETSQMDLLSKTYVVSMPDGSKWAVPVSMIVTSKVKHVRQVNRSMTYQDALDEVVAEFSVDSLEIFEWARGNMEWSEVSHVATQVSRSTTDYEDGWANGHADIV